MSKELSSIKFIASIKNNNVFALQFLSQKQIHENSTFFMYTNSINLLGEKMKKILVLLASLFVVVLLTGCGEETTGDKVDKAIDSTKEASEKAADSVKKIFKD